MHRLVSLCLYSCQKTTSELGRPTLASRRSAVLGGGLGGEAAGCLGCGPRQRASALVFCDGGVLVSTAVPHQVTCVLF